MTTILIWPQMLAWAGGLSLGYANIYYGSSDFTVRRQLFANSFWIALVLGICVGGLSTFIIPHFALLTQQQHMLLLISLWTLPLGFWMDYATSLLNSTGHFERLGIVRLASPAFAAVCLVFLWKMHSLTVLSAVLTAWAGSWLQFVLTIHYLGTYGCISFRPNLALLHRSLSYSSKMHIGTLAGLATGRLDQLVMTAIIAPKALGLYAFSVTLSEMLRQISASVVTVLYPKLSGEMSDDERGELAVKSTRWMLIIVSFSALLLFFIAPWIVPFIWGSRFVEAIPTLNILLPGTLALCVGITMVTSLRGAGKPGVTTAAELASLAVMMPLLWRLVPEMGIFGAGLASTCGYTVYCIVAAYYFKKTFGKDTLSNLCPTIHDWHYACFTFRNLRAKS